MQLFFAIFKNGKLKTHETFNGFNNNHVIIAPQCNIVSDWGIGNEP